MGTPTDPSPREQLLLVALMVAQVCVAAVIFTVALVVMT